MLNISLNFINNIKKKLFPFYKDKELKFVFNKIQEGFSPDTVTARFVGGCVRKYLSNDKIDDIDIATTLSAEEIKEKFKNTSLKVIETGIKHGTVTLVTKKFNLEITTLRKDVQTDGRHAEVEYIDDWQLDSERRDFTINAIYLDINGKIFDPQRGTFDLKNNNVKFIGDPETRIQEDYLRIIRLLRFAFQYNSSNDKTTIDALKFNLTGLKNISKERIFIELMKILSLKNFDNILEHKNKREIFLKIFPELKNLERLHRLKMIKNVFKIKNYELLALLVIDSSENYEYFFYKYNISKNLKETLKIYHECFKLINTNNAFFKTDLKKNIYFYGKKHLIFLNTLFFCDKLNYNKKIYLETNRMIVNTAIPKIKYDGLYLKNKGIIEGPVMGKILKKIEVEWIKNNFEISDKIVEQIISRYN